MLGGNLHSAFVAGIFAALGSVFGKLSGSTDLLERLTNILEAVPTDKKVSRQDNIHNNTIQIQQTVLIFHYFLWKLYCVYILNYSLYTP